MNEVKRALELMAARGAPGVDGMTVGLIRAGGARVVWWLVELFKKVWEMGRVPEEWKMGLLVPVFKKGSQAGGKL